MDNELILADDQSGLTRTEIIDQAMNRLREMGLKHGSFFKMEDLRALAGPYGHNNDFAFFLLEISKRCFDQKPRLILSQRGLKGSGLRALQAVEHFYIADSIPEKIDALLERGVLALVDNDVSALTEAERQRDANLAHELTMRRVMLKRYGDFERLESRRITEEKSEIESST